MSALLDLIPALLLGGLGLYAVLQGKEPLPGLTTGAADGLKTMGRIFPSLVCLLPAIYMFRASGALEALSGLLSPLFRFLGIPAETMPILLLRPLSGSAALASAGEIMSSCGADSIVGRTAAVMLGSTETTFYVLAVYFGGAGLKRTRYAVPAALCADLAGFLAART